MKHLPSYRKSALIIIILLVLIFVGCTAWIFSYQPDKSSLVADIYQDGDLIQSINLNDVAESYTFSVSGKNGGINIVEVRHGSIAVISADCPDKLCVRQGFISTSLLPVTCLPNHLVIQIRKPPTGNESEKERALGIITGYKTGEIHEHQKAEPTRHVYHISINYFRY